MKPIFAACLLASPILLVAAVPFDVLELLRQAIGIDFAQADAVPATLAGSCTCNGRQYNDVDAAKYSPAYFSNYENITFINCPPPLTRWKLNNLDRAVYTGTHFCGCITHQGAPPERPNGFVAC